MGRAIIRAERMGGSLILRLTKEVIEQDDIREGEMVEVEVRKVRKSGFGIMPGIGPMTREDELDTHD